MLDVKKALLINLEMHILLAYILCVFVFISVLLLFICIFIFVFIFGLHFVWLLFNVALSRV